MPSSKSKSRKKKKKEQKRTKTQHLQNRNPTKFCCNNETKTKQSCEKKTYQKLVLNRLKYSIYTIWEPNSRKPL